MVWNIKLFNDRLNLVQVKTPVQDCHYGRPKAGFLCLYGSSLQTKKAQFNTALLLQRSDDLNLLSIAGIQEGCFGKLPSSSYQTTAPEPVYYRYNTLLPIFYRHCFELIHLF